MVDFLLGSIAPKWHRDAIRQEMVYAGIEPAPERWVEEKAAISVVIGLVALILMLQLFSTPLENAIVITLGIIIFLYYFFYNSLKNKADKRGEEIEDILPDVLQLMAANVRSGSTPFTAMKLSAREEFGELKDEIEYVTARGMGTKSFDDLLRGLGERIKSPLLDNAIEVIIHSLESGGNMAPLLEEVSKEAIEFKKLEREVITSVRMYVSFIIFISIILAPVIFAISVNTTVAFARLSEQSAELDFSEYATESGATFLPFTGGNAIGEEIVNKIEFYATISLVSSAFFAALFLGVINEGSERKGLKYVGPFIVVSLIVFTMVKSIIEMLFSALGA